MQSSAQLIREVAQNLHDKAQVTEDLINSVNALLFCVSTLVSGDTTLSDKLRYQSKSKSDHRSLRALQYNGPDEATVELLKRHGEEWCQNPATFWHLKSTAHIPKFRDPQDEAVASCLQLRCGDAHARILYRFFCIALGEAQVRLAPRSEQQIATTLSKTELFRTLSFKYIRKTAQEVTTAGYRYRLIEQDVGRGFVCILGQNIAENTWQRLPKDGKVRQQVITHLKTKEIESLAQRYRPLRDAIINFKLDQWGLGPVERPESNQMPWQSGSPQHLSRTVNGEANIQTGSYFNGGPDEFRSYGGVEQNLFDGVEWLNSFPTFDGTTC